MSRRATQLSFIPQGHKFRLTRRAAQLCFKFSLVLFYLTFFQQNILASPVTPQTVKPSYKIEWYAVFLQDKKSGHMKVERIVANNKVTTRVTNEIVMGRLGTELKMQTIEEFIETIEGKALQFSFSMEGAGMSQKSNGVIKDGMVNITAISAGDTQTSQLPWSNNILMSEGLTLKLMKYRLKAGTAFSIKSFLPDTATIAETNIVIGEKEKVDLLGRVVTLTKLTTSMSINGLDITATSYLDQQGNALKTSVPLMGIKMEMIATDKSYALSQNEPHAFFASTFVNSPQPISKPQRQQPIVYHLSSLNHKKLSMINTDEQKASKREAKNIILAVKPQKIPNIKNYQYRGKSATVLAALKQNQWIQSQSPTIKKLAQHAIKHKNGSKSVVEAIEKFVFNYIVDKNLSVGYATALEVANSQQGDCTEHALLSTALYQAIGIPARVVTGFAYTASFKDYSHIFVPHAWTQVYLDGRWYSIDAALGQFDAGHIALQTGNGDPSAFYKLINTLNNLKITGIKSIAKENKI